MFKERLASHPEESEQVSSQELAEHGIHPNEGFKMTREEMKNHLEKVEREKRLRAAGGDETAKRATKSLARGMEKIDKKGIEDAEDAGTARQISGK